MSHTSLSRDVVTIEHREILPMRSEGIKRLARFAETNFASLCAAAGAICHESQEDENGWDCLVEFPAEITTGPADTHPPAKQAFVQIKSTRINRPSCSVKLSNALKAAQSRDPWFLVLTVESGTNPKIYAVHIWDSQIEKSLKAVRQASIENKPLHQRRTTFNFDDGDIHTDDLIDWMRGAIGSVVPDYGQSKKTIYETVGYAEGYGTGKITFAADNVDQILDEFLGLGNGVPVSRFTYTPARFGLSDSRPQIDMAEGRVEIKPTAAGDCELRMRGSGSSLSINLSAKIFTLGMPWLPFEEQRFRVSAIGFEIVWANDGDSKFTASLDFNVRVSLGEIERFATVITWLGHGPVDVQVWVKGARMVGGVLSSDPGQRKYDWRKVIDVVKTLQSLHPRVDTDELYISVADIDAGARDLYLMHEVTSTAPLSLEFFPLPEQTYDFSVVLYYCTATVGNLTAYALVERRVLNWTRGHEGRRRVEFGPAIIKESWIIPDASETKSRMVVDDYQHHLSEMEKGTKVLELSDIAVFVRSLQKGGLVELPSRP